LPRLAGPGQERSR